MGVGGILFPTAVQLQRTAASECWGGACRNYLKESQRCKVCANFKKRKETFRCACGTCQMRACSTRGRRETKSRDVVGIDDRREQRETTEEGLLAVSWTPALGAAWSCAHLTVTRGELRVRQRAWFAVLADWPFSGVRARVFFVY